MPDAPPVTTATFPPSLSAMAVTVLSGRGAAARTTDVAGATTRATAATAATAATVALRRRAPGTGDVARARTRSRRVAVRVHARHRLAGVVDHRLGGGQDTGARDPAHARGASRHTRARVVRAHRVARSGGKGHRRRGGRG